MRKSIELTGQLCEKYQISGWRQYRYNIKLIKKYYRKAQQSKKGNRKEEQTTKIQKEHQTYIEVSQEHLNQIKRTANSFQTEVKLSMTDYALLLSLNDFINHAERQIDQISRRVINGEVIPHNEKVFSLFEPHTEWICKGKLGVTVELGLRTCIMEDQHQFILHHMVMEKQTDEKVGVSMVLETKKRFAHFYSSSYDRGFYSKNNREMLQEHLEAFALPKKGRLSEADKKLEQSEKFLSAKQKHSAVESAINALDNHGLDKCHDHGLCGFKRYVALAIVARNIQNVGAILQKKEKRLLALRENRQKKKPY